MEGKCVQEKEFCSKITSMTSALDQAHQHIQELNNQVHLFIVSVIVV